MENHTLQPASLSLAIPGDILSTNAEDLRNRLFNELKTVEDTPGLVEVDLLRASMVDSVGLNLLVAIIRHVKARGGSLRFLIGNSNVERTFRATRLDSQAEIIRALAKG
jgi:anti-anti-sigma factor